MLEIRFHGRGGQGAVIGSEVLSRAFFLEDKYVQAFPAFGVERRGAPVTAFCRVDINQINLRSQIYKPDHIIILDPSLLQTVPVTDGLKNNGSILINGKHEPEYYRDILGKNFKIFIVDASTIAINYKLGSSSNPIVNTAILGAFSKSSGVINIQSIEKAIEDYVPVKKENNKKAAHDAYDMVVEA